jgi:aspartyl-tRNA(Asn)/glutamyl-tRNA(Gln) amidotransferase subunit C
MEFDKNSTLKLAKLARLSLNDEQLDSLEKDLTSIVSFIDQLKEINTEKN